ncbi:type IV secretory system conjugative DNA transfer family protein [Thalassococcus sp. S3]|uniref:type IV secretory system conjugative DNA transfer family protein n=1 Tax=Thalassococcus sp. S3 TaxID=2017482 RepID=UPI0010245F67|nr:type IV secretory system conjugative DNA transfer family protein [Thalassococcus sp. S3]QBF30061.1 hypothetical protein CFI11_02340 [Thalassococcus sp. S3]
MKFFRKKIPTIPFHGDLKTPLLSFGRDQFLLDDATRGVLVLGGTGSGKTSGSARALAMAYLKAGMGGLILCAKPDEADNWRAYAKATGREHDIIEINESADRRFNFLDYSLATIANKDGFQSNLLNVIDTITEAATASSGEGDGENRFFRDNAREMVSHVLPLLIAVYGRLTIKDIVAFIDSAPTTRADLESQEWQTGYAGRTLAAASLLMDDDPDLEVHGEYWLTRFVDWSDKTRSSVVSTFTSTVYPFLTGKLRDLFCSDTNWVPDMSHNGALIIANLPIKKFGQTGEVAQKIIKYLWQVSVEARTPNGKEPMRPVFLFADECQFFISSSSDAEFFSTARSARACGVYLTQDLPSFYSRLAGKGGEHDADALIGKFQTRIFHSNVDKTTNLAAAEMIGKITKQQASRQQNFTQNRGEGGAYQAHDVAQSDNSGLGRSTSETLSTYQDYAVPPEYFTNQLRNGTKANRFKVDGIVVTGGKTWKHSRANFIKAEFDQRL